MGFKSHFSCFFLYSGLFIILLVAVDFTIIPEMTDGGMIIGKDTVGAFCKNRFQIFRAQDGLFRLHDGKKNIWISKIETWEIKGGVFLARSEGKIVKISDCETIEVISGH